MSGVRKWNHWVWKIFEQGSLARRNRYTLYRVIRAFAMTVQARGAGRRDLRVRIRSNLNIERHAIAREHTTRDIMQVYQSRAIRLSERSNHFPGRFLTIHMQPGPRFCGLEAQRQGRVQLMKSRVSSKPWRIDAISGKGVKHETSAIQEWSGAAARAMAGCKLQMMRCAAVWPSGIRRWHAETRPVTDCC